jgi:4-phosphopantoate--beta-alanine ligase
MRDKEHVSPRHPRAESIRIREKLTKEVETGVVALAGLIAHGRGEAFDYILGECTTSSARKAVTASAASLLLAEHPVLSVNGNVAALCPVEVVELASVTGSKIEVNLFHRTPGREEAVERLLRAAGACEVYGLDAGSLERIPEVYSDRRQVDHRGILMADVVFVPLEDGDRTEALVRMGKKVITVDLNPLSRTARSASVTIVDNIVRAMPLLVSEVERLSGHEDSDLRGIVSGFDNGEALSDAMRAMRERLKKLSEKDVSIGFDYQM